MTHTMTQMTQGDATFSALRHSARAVLSVVESRLVVIMMQNDAMTQNQPLLSLIEKKERVIREKGWGETGDGASMHAISSL